MNEKYYCPVNGWDCPYGQKDGSCTCENPTVECGDAAWWEKYFNDLEEEMEEEKELGLLDRVFPL